MAQNSKKLLGLFNIQNMKLKKILKLGKILEILSRKILHASKIIPIQFFVKNMLLTKNLTSNAVAPGHVPT